MWIKKKTDRKIYQIIDAFRDGDEVIHESYTVTGMKIWRPVRDLQHLIELLKSQTPINVTYKNYEDKKTK